MIRKWCVKGQIPETQKQENPMEKMFREHREYYDALEAELPPQKRCEKMGSLPCGPTCCKDTEKGVNNSVP
jgi:hypothetical protein